MLSVRTSVLLFILLLFGLKAAQAHNCQPFLQAEILSDKKLELFEVSWKELIPGQTHIGWHLINNPQFRKKLKVQKNQETYILRKPIPVVMWEVKGTKRYIMLDNHHTLLRFVKAYENKAPKDKPLEVEVEVVHTIRNMTTDKEVMSYLLEKNWIWNEQVLTNKPWSFEKNWPQNVLELRDLPVRSVVQLMFYELDLSGKSFLPYTQFSFAKELLAQGFNFKARELDGGKKQEKLKARLLQFVFSNEYLLDYLLGSVREQDDKGASSKIKKRLKAS